MSRTTTEGCSGCFVLCGILYLFGSVMSCLGCGGNKLPIESERQNGGEVAKKADNGSPDAIPQKPVPEVSKIEWNVKRRQLQEGGLAFLSPTTDETVVRLIKTSELHKLWIEATDTKDEIRLIDIITHPLNPVIPVDEGARVAVLRINAETALIELLDGTKAGQIGYCRVTELDAGRDLIPVELEIEIKALREPIELDKAESLTEVQDRAFRDRKFSGSGFNSSVRDLPNRGLPVIVDFRLPSAGKTVHVRSYTRKDGTFVREHYRSPPGHGITSSKSYKSSTAGGKRR